MQETLSYNPKVNPVIHINTFDKYMCLISTVGGLVGFLVSFMMQGEFLNDDPKKEHPINIENNDFFNFTRDILGIKQRKSNQMIILISNTIFNVSLIGLFWAQHMVLSKLNIKQRIINKYNKYILYERAMFNITASLLIIAVFIFWQPVNIPIFKFDEKFRPFFTVISLAGAIAVLKSMYDMYGPADVFGFEFCKRVFKKDTISFQERYISGQDEGIQVRGLYNYCRHPMQLGGMMNMCFSGLSISLSRILFLTFMLYGVKKGVDMEEKKLCEMCPSYKIYKEEVKHQFIPHFFTKHQIKLHVNGMESEGQKKTRKTKVI